MRHDTILPFTSSQLLSRLYRVGHMKFRGEYPKSCSISSKMSLQQHQGLLLYLSLKKLKMWYFPPNPLVLLPIEYLWLILLANVPRLWQMQTIGKTESFTRVSCSLISESRNREYFKRRTAAATILLLNVCIEGKLAYYNWQTFLSQYVWRVHRGFNWCVNSNMGNCWMEDWLGVMYNRSASMLFPQCVLYWQQFSYSCGSVTKTNTE